MRLPQQMYLNKLINDELKDFGTITHFLPLTTNELGYKFLFLGIQRFQCGEHVVK